MTSQPNPGSPEAVKLGCICPIYDNGKGKGLAGEHGNFWIHTRCPMHGKPMNKGKPK